jgi:hypothetical protein
MNTGILLASAVALGLGSGCNGRRVERPYPAPKLGELLAALLAREAAVTSFRAESVMDYWVGDERVKGDVYLMGKAGSRLRFNALNATGGNVAVDLACDGFDYQLIDYNHNCQRAGACNSDAIAGLLRVRLEPRDFFRLAVGSVPLLEAATAELSWDAEDAVERIVLTASDGRTQVIELDGRDRRWDVVASTRRDEHGAIEWTLRNKGFHVITGEGGAMVRVPDKTRFQQPRERADLVIDWRAMRVNPPLDDAKFRLEIPLGLPPCR